MKQLLLPLSLGPGALSRLAANKLGGYFYFHGARGAFLRQLGRTEEARMAFDRAIALANTPAEAAHIREQLDRLASGAAP